MKQPWYEQRTIWEKSLNGFSKVRVKYEYNDMGEPTGTTFVAINVGAEFFIGSSICSDKDQFSRKVGRNIALVRAIYAYNAFRVSPTTLAMRAVMRDFHLKGILCTTASKSNIPSMNNILLPEGLCS